jgi:hypothetical protein
LQEKDITVPSSCCIPITSSNKLKAYQTAIMMGFLGPVPHILSLSLNGHLWCEINIIKLIARVVLVTYCVFLLFWLRHIANCPFFKAIKSLAVWFGGFLEYPQGFDNGNDGGNDNNKNHDNAAKDPEQQASVSSDPSDDTLDHPFVPCSVCHEKIKALRPSCIEINSLPESPALYSTVPKDTIETITHQDEPVSFAKAALTSLADDLEFDLSHLTQAEADDMLVELDLLRSTVGSRVCLFTKESDAPVDAFDTDSWWGEVCLIDALKWLIRKRFPGQNSSELGFAGFEPEKEKSNTEEKRKGKEHDIRDRDHEDTEQQKNPEMQSEDRKEAKSGHTISCALPSPHVYSGLFARGYPPAPPRRLVPLPTARDVINSVASGLKQQFQYLTSSEIDTIIGRLKSRRDKIIARGTHAIESIRKPGHDATAEQRRKYATEANAQVDAHVALVDGIILAIREQCDSSQSPLTEKSDWSWSQYASESDDNDRR